LARTPIQLNDTVREMARTETPAEHAILGLLALSDENGLGYGYDLARHFGGGQPLGDVLRLEAGMLYHHLKKMARSGWVEAAVETPGARPPRRVYRLTSAGAAELRRWLSEPVEHTREIRLEFLVKLYFARRLDPALAGRLLAEQRERCAILEVSLARQLAALDAPAASESAETGEFSRLVLQFRLAQTRAAAAWLAEIDAGEES
jgi:DNA-binding PadR family transcriptional regulator